MRSAHNDTPAPAILQEPLHELKSLFFIGFFTTLSGRRCSNETRRYKKARDDAGFSWRLLGPRYLISSLSTPDSVSMYTSAAATSSSLMSAPPRAGMAPRPFSTLSYKPS